MVKQGMANRRGKESWRQNAAGLVEQLAGMLQILGLKQTGVNIDSTLLWY